MATTSSSFMVEESGACVLLVLHHRTIVVSLEVDVHAPDATQHATFVVWALTVPRREHTFADGFYSTTLPVPLGHVTYPTTPLHPGRANSTAVLALGRWELPAGTRVALVLAPADSPVDVVRRVLGQRVRAGHSAAPQADAQDTSALSTAARWKLCGSQVVQADAADAAEWRPLLHRRWYELKSYVREGTAVPYYASRGVEGSGSESDGEGRDAGQSMPQPMYAGDVREADAISLNRQCVRWVDGGVGLFDELKPFYRVYQPAREEKTVRVRRFPHRYADVVGEVPHGHCVEAFGRAIDPFTQEAYVLLYLPSGDRFVGHVSTYDLTFVENDRYVWGWSKVAGSSGLPLLTEAHTDEADDTGNMERHQRASAHSSPASLSNGHAASGAQTSRSAASRALTTEVMQLPEATFYTPVRTGRAVRIRKRPTLTSSTLREMESNEVRAADALLTVPLRLPANPSGPAVPHVFVQWQQGGYSLLRNETECFLAPVLLSRVPRRFPIRTRSDVHEEADGEAKGEGEEEVIDLSRQRSRKRDRRANSSDSGDVHTEKLQAMLHRRGASAAGAADDSLLSPYSLPTSLQEGLRRGVVRLEDLPPLRPSSEEEEEDEEEMSEDSDMSDD